MSLICLLCAVVQSSFAQNAPRPTLIRSFESGSDFSSAYLGTDHTSVAQVHQGVTDGFSALEVTTPISGGFPNVHIWNPGNWDFSNTSGIGADISTQDRVGFTVTMGFFDIHGASITRDIFIAPRQMYHIWIPAAQDPNFDPTVFGMEGLPNAFPIYQELNGYIPQYFDYAHVSEIRFYVTAPTAVHHFDVDNIVSFPVYNATQLLSGALDAYGQYTGGVWPNRVSGDSDLTTRGSSEQAVFASDPPNPERDQYGGWATGPHVTATGYFYTTNYNGKWWFVDPIGNLFWSSGVNGVTTENNWTMVAGREYMFQWLPTSTEPMGAFYENTTAKLGPVLSGTAYNYAKSNLCRKFGPTWDTNWRTNVAKRFNLWGFNTIGAYSDNSWLGHSTVPYTVAFDTEGPYNHISTGDDHWGPTPDPYDPMFLTNIQSRFSYYAGVVKNDPYCIGYFVDNEMNWIAQNGNCLGLGYGILSQDTSYSYAKRAFISFLQNQYQNNIFAFNAIWGTSFSSWAAMNGNFQAPILNWIAQADMYAFLGKFCDTYFSEVKSMLKSLDPNHLFLGCRFGSYTTFCVQSCAKYADVVSFNRYQWTCDPADYTEFQAFGKPFLFGEFAFDDVNESGKFFHWLPFAWNQGDRGQAFTRFMTAALNNPWVIGCHWHTYYDQPTLGYTVTGENKNMGLIDETDTPYQPLVSAAKALQKTLYTTRGQ